MPEELQELTKLERLVAQNLKITTLPASVERLRSLVEIDLAGCPLESLPACISELSSLRTLVMAGSRLTDLPESFARLPRLESVTLNFGRFSEVPPALPECPALRTIHLGQNTIEDIGPIVRSRTMNANLVTLDVSVGPISRLTGISSMRALKELVLTGTRVADLEEIGALPNLERLWIKGTLAGKVAAKAFRAAHPKVTVYA